MNRKIRVDEKTGEYFESGKLAPKAYARIMDETAAIKVSIQKKLNSTYAKRKLKQT